MISLFLEKFTGVNQDMYAETWLAAALTHSSRVLLRCSEIHKCKILATRQSSNIINTTWVCQHCYFKKCEVVTWQEAPSLCVTFLVPSNHWLTDHHVITRSSYAIHFRYNHWFFTFGFCISKWRNAIQYMLSPGTLQEEDSGKWIQVKWPPLNCLREMTSFFTARWQVFNAH